MGLLIDLFLEFIEALEDNPLVIIGTLIALVCVVSVVGCADPASTKLPVGHLDEISIRNMTKDDHGYARIDDLVVKENGSVLLLGECKVYRKSPPPPKFPWKKEQKPGYLAVYRDKNWDFYVIVYGVDSLKATDHDIFAYKHPIKHIIFREKEGQEVSVQEFVSAFKLGGDL